jgi:hypothetical protein
MASIRKALLFGFLVWLIPFVVAFAVFPFREANRALFESIMAVILAVATVVFGLLYMRGVTRRFVVEGILIGAIWYAMSVAIDAPLMLLGGPMKMGFGEYMADIGLTYLMIPAVTIGLGFAAARAVRAASREAAAD